MCMGYLILMQENRAPFIEDFIFSKNWKVAFRRWVFTLNFLSIFLLNLSFVNDSFSWRSFPLRILQKWRRIQLISCYYAHRLHFLASQYDMCCICGWVEFYRISRNWNVLRLLVSSLPLVLLSDVNVWSVVD